MTKRCVKLLEKAKNNPKAIRFTELRRLCKCVGMVLKGTEGSHFIYKRDNPTITLSIQRFADGTAKPYQVRQLIDFIEEYNLDREG